MDNARTLNAYATLPRSNKGMITSREQLKRLHAEDSVPELPLTASAPLHSVSKKEYDGPGNDHDIDIPIPRFSLTSDTSTHLLTVDGIMISSIEGGLKALSSTESGSDNILSIGGATLGHRRAHSDSTTNKKRNSLPTVTSPSSPSSPSLLISTSPPSSSPSSTSSSSPSTSSPSSLSIKWKDIPRRLRSLSGGVIKSKTSSTWSSDTSFDPSMDALRVHNPIYGSMKVQQTLREQKDKSFLTAMKRSPAIIG
eukprot:TRINITY_DN9486_c0_g3_i1.p1 TRINITY_DN9486_c0_g3~~TRINITY_DN9486_c0_g3_i1.p1  ORF type:complete len:281 (+),score=43.03 TRINITY_DN9486_c0_g3_i1:85-843(+)